MAEIPYLDSGLCHGDSSPDRVIKHMMALADFAEMHGFAGFEAKLLEAVEAFLIELNESDRPALLHTVVQKAGNVVPFVPLSHRAPGGALQDGGQPC